MSGSGGEFGPAGLGAAESPPFAVAGPSQVTVAASRSGTGSFTVSNVTGRPVRARVLVVPGAGADTSWFQVQGEQERALPVAGTTTVDVAVNVPKDTPAGAFSFVLGAALEESPDQVVSGPTATFQVPEPVKAKFPWWIVIVAAIAALLLATGGLLIWNTTRPATSPSPTPLDTRPPSPSPSPTDTGPAAAWLSNGRSLAIETWGSASCVPTAGNPVFSGGTLVVEMTDSDPAQCGTDQVPRASLVTPEEQLNMAQDLRIVLTGDYEGFIKLPGIPGKGPTDLNLPSFPMTVPTRFRLPEVPRIDPGNLPKFTKRPVGPTSTPTLKSTVGPGFFADPSAGWFSRDGFVLLTYGSSSCPPEVESVNVSGSDEVTLTIITQDRKCTLDLAPRLAVAVLDGSLLGDGQVDAVVDGGGFTGLRVPIEGLR